MLEREGEPQGLVNWVLVGILLWGLIAAIGVARYDQLHAQFNVIKPAVIIVCTLVIVGAWRFALRHRRNRAE